MSNLKPLADPDSLAGTIASGVRGAALEPSPADAAARLRRLERLNQTVILLLRTLAAEPDEQVQAGLLKIILESFHSQAGLFLWLNANESLVGSYLSESEFRQVEVDQMHRCELWNQAFALPSAMIENHSRPMGCGRRLVRSLVTAIVHEGAPLGVVHLGDAEADYDDDDRELLTRVARLIAPSLHARRKRDLLTAREREVMDMIVSGQSQKQIAISFGISVQTVAKHRARILEKLSVRNDIELLRLALLMRSPFALEPGGESVLMP